MAHVESNFRDLFVGSSPFLERMLGDVFVRGYHL